MEDAIQSLRVGSGERLVIESPEPNRVARVCFRDMTPDDVAAGLELCRAARWNQTERDWRLFLRLSPEGCRVAIRDERVVATVATTRYEDRFAWIGMVLVDPAERGQGIGARLTAEALEVLKHMPSIRLDATPVGHAVYKKLGFVDEYRLSRMEAVVSSAGLALRRNPARPMTKDDLPDVAIFDREVFGADRRLALGWMFDGAPEYAWIIEEGGQIAGYTFGRRGFKFEHLGPIVARDRRAARRLVSTCLNRQAGKPFIIDASHYDTDWRSWLESIGFREQRPFIRMFYRDNPYPGLPPKQFGILGPEFG
jgi:predicted N-acetyltransferase YhbS